MHAKDFLILSDIQQFFKVGKISQTGINSILYQVNSIKELADGNYSAFCQFPLISKKKGDFLLFKLAIEWIRKKEHLCEEGINKLVGIKAYLNRGLSE